MQNAKLKIFGLRPTQGLVKKAVFDILGDISGLSFADLFSGTGAVGFDALRKGVKKAILVENSAPALKIINKNASLEKLNPNQELVILPVDALEAIRRFFHKGDQFDVIFLDPPYYHPIRNDRHLRSLISNGVNDVACHVRGKTPKASVSSSVAKKTLQMLDEYDILTPSGIIVVQHFKKDILPPDFNNLIFIKQHKYGDTVLSLYKKVTRSQQ